VSVRVALSETIYPRECLEEAVAAYSAFCSIEVASCSAGACEIEIVPAEYGNERPDENRLVNEFLNYLLDLSLEHHLGKA
jgi:hypothetical protein